jgi:hypothetical protein
MLLMGLEPMIPVFERANTVQPSDRAATVFGIIFVLVDANILLNAL